MITTTRLTELILNCDFTYAEIENLCGGFLGLKGDALGNVLGNGTGSWQHRITDLVDWADRQGLIDELTKGVLHYGSNKRAVREWILNTQMESNQSDIFLALLKIENKVDRVTEKQSEFLQRLIVLERHLENGKQINWSVILIALILSVGIAGGTTLLAMVR